MAILTKAQLYAVLAAGGVTDPVLARILAAGAWAESRWNTEATGDNGHSIGLWQLHDQGAGAGMTVAARQDPATALARILPHYEAAYAEWAGRLDGAELASQVAGQAERPWDWQNPESAARRGYAAAWDVAAPETAPTQTAYNADQPAERQLQDWTCSVRVATWMLKSIGIPIEAGVMQVRMQAAGLVSPALGLHDGSGAALAAWLTAEFGVPAYAGYPADWDDVHEFAGASPVGLGSGGYYHWLAVRREHDDGTLDLMNPAPNWRDLGETLTLAEWQRGAPWALLWIAVAPPAEEAEDMAIAAEQARIALEEILPNIDKALAKPLPKVAREALQYGARPATQTIIRNGGLEAPE